MLIQKSQKPAVGRTDGIVISFVIGDSIIAFRFIKAGIKRALIRSVGEKIGDGVVLAGDYIFGSRHTTGIKVAVYVALVLPADIFGNNIKITFSFSIL